MPVRYESRLPEIAAKLPLAVNRAARRGASRVSLGAQARAPVETGALKRAIHVEGREGGYAVVAWSDEAFYAHMVEHGTRHSAAQPFLVPALEANRASILADVVGELRRLG